VEVKMPSSALRKPKKGESQDNPIEINKKLKSLRRRHGMWTAIGVCSHLIIIGIIVHLIDRGIIGYLLLISIVLIYLANRATKELAELIDEENNSELEGNS
jgi:hypothetical protein